LDCDPDARHLASDQPSAPVEPERPQPAHASLPRLGRANLIVPSPPPLSDDLRQRLHDLDQARVAGQSSADSAKAQFKTGLDQLIQAPVADFDRALASLSHWRNQERIGADLQTGLEAHIETVRRLLQDRFGVAVTLSNGVSLAERVEAAEAAVWAS